MPDPFEKRSTVRPLDGETLELPPWSVEITEFHVILSLVDREDQPGMDELAIEGKVLMWDPDEWSHGARPFVELAESPTWAEMIEIATRMGNYTGDTIHRFLEAVVEVTHPAHRAAAGAVASEAGIEFEGVKIYRFWMGS